VKRESYRVWYKKLAGLNVKDLENLSHLELPKFVGITLTIFPFSFLSIHFNREISLFSKLFVVFGGNVGKLQTSFLFAIHPRFYDNSLINHLF